jgi:hypothetical protein
MEHGTTNDSLTTSAAAISPSSCTEQHGRPCSPPAAELEAKEKFRADREEWLAHRRAGGGIQVKIVTATGGFVSTEGENN